MLGDASEMLAEFILSPALRNRSLEFILVFPFS